jgi:hypothetical protein
MYLNNERKYFLQGKVVHEGIMQDSTFFSGNILIGEIKET